MEDYCKVNCMHLTNSSFNPNTYALVIHDAPGVYVPGVSNIPCHRLSGYYSPKELLIWLDGYHKWIQNEQRKHHKL